MILAALSAIFSTVSFAEEGGPDLRPSVVPDIREEDSELVVETGDFVAVPIPMSNPTIGTGLILGGAYFWPQTEQEKSAQPASLTAAAALYTNNDSMGLAVVQQNYWNRDRWRFTGALGATDLRLSLLAPGEASVVPGIDWRVEGTFVLANISRRVMGNWYLGVFGRSVNATQSVEFSGPIDGGFEIGPVRSTGIGASLEYDSRDMPINTYSGQSLKVSALFNDKRFGSKKNYQSYNAAFRSYHTLTDSWILGWELRGCRREGSVPLWDACMINLRGFSVTDHIGKGSASGQVEARWRMNQHWGLVGFGGAGYITSTFNDYREQELVPSYGVGIRYMVLATKRINLRVDYGRSGDSDALYLSVGEAF